MTVNECYLMPQSGIFQALVNNQSGSGKPVSEINDPRCGIKTPSLDQMIQYLVDKPWFVGTNSTSDKRRYANTQDAEY